MQAAGEQPVLVIRHGFLPREVVVAELTQGPTIVRTCFAIGANNAQRSDIGFMTIRDELFWLLYSALLQSSIRLYA